jgi:antirestriction protein ArdC
VQTGDTPPLALATLAGVGQGQGVSIKDTAFQFKNKDHTRMRTNDKAQELNARINDSINALCAETDAAKQSETFRNWLSTLSRFHNYSFGNSLLIAMQAPDATHVAGFHTWKSLGRFVKKGETGIRILAPIIRKIEQEKNGTTEKVSRPFGFRTVTVFSYAQTDGEPLPEMNTNATEGGEALLPALERAAAQLDVILVYKAISGNAEGYSKGGLIEIEETLDTPARCGVIIHELAHELMHKGSNREGTTKQQRELEAEAVSYAVLAHFGIHSDSRFYLAMYNVTGEMLTASLQAISAAAKRIINMLEPTSPPATPAVVEEDDMRAAA